MDTYLRVVLAGIALMTVALPGDSLPAAKAWSIAVCGPVLDPRRPGIAEAVDFWNDQLAGIKVRLSLGPITACERIVPDAALVRISEEVLKGERLGRLPPEFDNINGDVVIILSGADLISVGIPRAGGRQGLVILRRADVPPLSLANVSRNVAAHELGHVLEVSHNSDSATLMCGRPAPCRPARFRSDTKRFFPLTDADRRGLMKRFN